MVKMTSSMEVRLTPAQRCILDLLQRRLFNTIQSYARLSLEKQRNPEDPERIEGELYRLKEKIRRISARQKRFTLEITNGNGNNTIPKERFFEALGLVTKEALSKLNSKTGERRRRTTANPRFSHEAILAKRALEPLQKRLEPKVRDKRETSNKKPQRYQSAQDNIMSNQIGNSVGGKNNSNQQALNNATNKVSGRSSSNRNRNLIQNDRRELLEQFDNLQRQINSKVDLIKDKQESNRELERQNELIKKRGLDIISAINIIDPHLGLQQHHQRRQLDDNNHSQDPCDQGSQTVDTTATATTTKTSGTQPEPQLDIWIDMKCEESLDGLD